MKSDDKLIIGDADLGKGRFAVIKKGVIVRNGSKREVAVKMLKNTDSKEDFILLKAKMNFLASGVPFSEYIVNLMAAVQEGPYLILELCEMTLKDWLGKVKESGQTEKQDDMIQFASHISKGMAHLHHNNIIHRRLAARNIYLFRSPVGLIAKVSGFGPMKGESGKGDERVPIKWLAPEILDEEDGKPRAYTKESDVWSFGITLWEIYTLGDTPYAKHRSHEVKDLLASGYRLPKPKSCPEPLYNNIMGRCWSQRPGSRPRFDDVSDECARLFHDDEDGEFYYGPARQTNLTSSDDVYDDVPNGKNIF